VTSIGPIKRQVWQSHSAGKFANFFNLPTASGPSAESTVQPLAVDARRAAGDVERHWIKSFAAVTAGDVCRTNDLLSTGATGSRARVRIVDGELKPWQAVAAVYAIHPRGSRLTVGPVSGHATEDEIVLNEQRGIAVHDLDPNALRRWIVRRRREDDETLKRS
jgi:hypothetical protein